MLIEGTGAELLSCRSRHVSAQPEQPLIETFHLDVRRLVGLIPMQVAALEGTRVLWIRNVPPRHRIAKRRKCAELFPSSRGHLTPQLLVMVGEEHEGRARRPFLAHE